MGLNQSTGSKVVEFCLIYEEKEWMKSFSTEACEKIYLWRCASVFEISIILFMGNFYSLKFLTLFGFVFLCLILLLLLKDYWFVSRRQKKKREKKQKKSDLVYNFGYFYHQPNLFILISTALVFSGTRDELRKKSSSFFLF